LEWNTPGSSVYESSLDRGVLYVDGHDGVPWNGLISVEESSSGGEGQPYYIDGFKYRNSSTDEDFEATITAFTYPDEFAKCDGVGTVRPGLIVTQQPRSTFGLSYRTKVGTELEEEFGYKIHLIYNALVTPSHYTYETSGNSPKPINFSWNISTRPVMMAGFKPTAHVVIDSRYTDPKALATIEDFLYGSNLFISRMPTFEQLVDIFDTPEFRVTDNGDGTFTVIAPDFAINMTGPDTYELTWPTAIPTGSTYTISSP
jgi:hypothetical protein